MPVAVFYTPFQDILFKVKLHLNVTFLFPGQVTGHKDTVPNRQKTAAPRGSFCRSQLLQVQTCWKPRCSKAAVQQLCKQASGTRARDAPRHRAPVVGVRLLEKLGPRAELGKVLSPPGCSAPAAPGRPQTPTERMF